MAKVFGHNITVNYRESYGLFACSCICFNHESPRRGAEFVSRKITQHVARIKLGLTDTLKLGNLDAERDWGYAGDYIRAMWLAMQQPAPDDYVVATGVTHTVQQLLEAAFSCAGLNWKAYVELDSKLVRPAEVDHLCGDATKARNVLGWNPEVNFEQLIEMMVESDLQTLKENSASRTLATAI